MSARVLSLDIETSPVVAHIWGLRDLNVGINQIVEDPRILGFGYKWRDQKKVHWTSEWDDGREAMLGTAHALLDEADVVIHYNGDRFDIPWIYGELARVGLTPPSPFKNIDLYKIAKKNLRFPSHKLQYVSTALGLPGKLDTGGHQLWVDCINGDTQARRKMATYCKRDVALLEPLFEKLRPWMGSQVNFALFEPNDGRPHCQKCGSAHVTRQGLVNSTVAKFQQYQCQDCGGWFRDTRSVERVGTTGVAR